MARSPATPNKGNPAADELASKGAASSPNDMVSVTSMLQQTALHEPSPASTYGDTAGSSSVPATPQDYRVSSKSPPSASILMHSLVVSVFCIGACTSRCRRALLSDSLLPRQQWLWSDLDALHDQLGQMVA